jgi:hypothetical protein
MNVPVVSSNRSNGHDHKGIYSCSCRWQYLKLLFFFAVPRRQEKTYPAALPTCPIDVGCLGGIIGGFELLPPVHVFRNFLRHPVIQSCPSVRWGTLPLHLGEVVWDFHSLKTCVQPQSWPVCGLPYPSGHWPVDRELLWMHKRCILTHYPASLYYMVTIWTDTHALFYFALNPSTYDSPLPLYLWIEIYLPLKCEATSSREGPVVVCFLCAIFEFRLTPNDLSHAYQKGWAGFPFQTILNNFLCR